MYSALVIGLNAGAVVGTLCVALACPQLAAGILLGASAWACLVNVARHLDARAAR